MSLKLVVLTLGRDDLKLADPQIGSCILAKSCYNLSSMKANLHPTWYHDCVVTCSCGNSFVTGSNTPTLQIDICNKCHPFFTGEVKFVDRQGRVDRFKKKVADAQAKVQQTKKKSDAPQEEAKSYREILREKQLELRTQGKKTAKATEDSGKPASPAKETTKAPEAPVKSK